MLVQQLLQLRNRQATQVAPCKARLAQLHALETSPFVQNVVRGQFVATNGTGAMTIQPLSDTGRMKQVGARQARHFAVDGNIFQAAYAVSIDVFHQVFGSHNNNGQLMDDRGTGGWNFAIAW
jgi:hypothetical protein